MALTAAGLLGLGGGVVTFAVVSWRRGFFDARARYTPEPSYLYAHKEPLWFYGLLLLILALGAGLLLVSGAMGWHALRRPRPVLRKGPVR